MKRWKRISQCMALTCLSALSLAATAQGAGETATLLQAPLTEDQVVRALMARNLQRGLALEQYTGTRLYRLEYRGFPGDREAEMTVRVDFAAPASKQFAVTSETGSKVLIQHVLRKLIESESEAANETNQRAVALDTNNYQMKLVAYEPEHGGQYVLQLTPRTSNKFLYRGRIWVDARDFAVVRIEAEPAKNPSFWIRHTEIRHHYAKVGEFWLPAENRTVSITRTGGKATLTIEYRDYQITRARSLALASHEVAASN